jgi:hypothetical protein
MKYDPKVNDYVKWKSDLKGWVYFKCSNYITLEILVRPKDSENYKASPIHANNRVLLLCYEDEWENLEYVQSRSFLHEKFEDSE